MTAVTIKYIFMILGTICFLFFVRNIFMFLFSTENYSTHKKRLKQLEFNNNIDLTEDEQTRAFVEKITRPVLRYIIPKMKIRNMDELEKDLKMTKWDKYFNASQYMAMNVTLKIIGVVALVLLIPVSIPFALIWFTAFFFLFGFLFNNSVKENKAKLLAGFPDFIRITRGYLSAGIPFTQAVEGSIPYVGEAWRPLLQEFIVNCDIHSVEEAIDKLREKVDIFAVRELLSLVRLNLEQGADVRESFERQIDKVREMQLEAIMNKIAKRQLLAMALQGPLLLTLIGAFGLPTFYSMTTLSSM
ncbi:type II secretion system F family protein [Bacillus sp. NPDC094106]|uniref:type II secretion system F family protein n=1 Tax=Bacillus sp. NPDC094106 TaxID=3363949 RepID=UPI0037F9F5BA